MSFFNLHWQKQQNKLEMLVKGIKELQKIWYSNIVVDLCSHMIRCGLYERKIQRD